MQFTTLCLTVLTAIVATSGNPIGLTHDMAAVADIKDWLAKTDATITYINDSADGATVDGVTPRSILATTVVYCNRRTVNVCGGECTVYTGGAKCLNAPGTQCLRATNNVGFCDRAGCSGSCNQLSTCGTRLDNGFCSTPGTRSILVGA